MKITLQDYSTILNAMAPLACSIPAMRTILSRDIRVKDIERRLRWDLCHKAGLTPFLCDTVYQYANDDHIDTALKAAIRELENT